MQRQVTLNSFTGNTFDTYPSFTLNINKDIYLFNVPEMTQKMILSNKMKHKSIKAAFITSLYPDSVGGLSTFVIQSFHTLDTIFSIVGPTGIPDVILFDTDYIKDEKHQIDVSNTFSNNDLEVTQINLPKSLCYDVNLTIIEQRMLVVDCRSIDDIRFLPDLSQFSVIVHLTIPEIFLQKEYIDFFTSHVRNNSPRNICFMPSGKISNYPSRRCYDERRCDSLQPLSYGKTLKPPKGFFDFTTYGSTYNFATRRTAFTHKNQFVCVDYNKLNSLDKYDIFSELTTFSQELPQFDKYAVTFLGSSTKFVSEERSNSGYLIHTKYGFIVLDPSEGFLCQVERKYGPKATKHILMNIECVWLSHFHQDHCFGVPSLLHERSKVTDKQIYFCGPQKFIDDIKKMSAIYGDFHVIYHNRESEGREQTSAEDMSDVPSELVINEHLSLLSIDVYHGIQYSKGCMIVIDGERKIAFSGDRAFQKDHFAEAFKNCDLLIHEATFPDATKSNSKVMTIEGHCFEQEAVKTVNLMNPKFAIFTHLSLRYKDNLLKVKPAKNIHMVFDYLELTSDNIETIFKKC